MIGIRSQLHKNDRIIIAQLLRLFHEVDKEAQRFKKLTGIHCPQMCAACCVKSNVETTALEMLPVALELWLKDEADVWLKKIESTRHAGLCVFFKPQVGMPENGRCMIYSLRPLVCRLFGFFTIKDKYGNYVYGSCKVIREKYLDSYHRATKLIAEGFHPSNMTDFAIRLIGMNSGLGRKMIPINLATKIALEKVGFDLENRKKEER